MLPASLTIMALVGFAFSVHRWASDEIAARRRLSASAAAALTVLFGLYASVVALAAAGGVMRLASPGPVSLVGGGVLALLGLAAAAAALRTLGSREVLLGMRIDEVVVRGPYAWSRHPLYLGISLLFAGVAVMSLSTLAIELAVVAAVALARIARGEERLLLQERGAAYSSYRDLVHGIAGRRRESSSDAVAAVSDGGGR